jgi:hypothetical protein
MDHSAIRSQLPTLVAGHLPRNTHRFKFRVYDDKPPISSPGFLIDPKPFEGTVVAQTDSAIIIKVARTQFAVIDRQLATQEPAVGARVEVIPYARRDFDGRRLDVPTEETRYTNEGQPYTVRSVILGGATTKLPIPEPRCPELAALVRQLQEMPAPDGFRRITHLLVDAGARDFSWVDPGRADIIRTPPAIRFTVSTNKFRGRVTLLYERVLDLYAVELHDGDTRVERVSDVYFDGLGEVLERLIDDGVWRLIQVRTLLGKSARARH